MGEKALQETWNRTERENCNEIWHLHFKSSQVFPVRASLVLTLSFQTPQCQWGRVFQREVFSRGVRPAPAAPADISRCAPTRGWRCRALLLPSGPARPRTHCTPQLSVCRAMQRAPAFGSAQLPSCAFVHPLHCSHKTPASVLFPCCLAGQERAALQTALHPRSCSSGCHGGTPKLLITAPACPCLLIHVTPRRINFQLY